MKFLENRYLYHEHLLSYSTRVEADKLIDMLIFAGNNIDALELKATGKTIFRITEIIPRNSTDIYGIEILIPIERPFGNQGQCIYKPAIKIDNAVSFMFCNVDEICETENWLYGYLRRNNMKPITDIYYVLIQSEKGSKTNNVIEAYIGISSNIV